MEGATMADTTLSLTPTRAAVLESYLGSNPGAAAHLTTLNLQKAQKWLVDNGFIAPRAGVPAYSVTAAGLKAYTAGPVSKDVAVIQKVQAARRRNALGAWATTEVAQVPAPAPDNDVAPVVGDLVLASRDRGHRAITRYVLQQVKPLNGIPFAWLRQVGGKSFPILHLNDLQLLPVYAGPAAMLPAAA